MKRKITIGSAVMLVGLLSAAIPCAAYAGSPLLSGYGGPGAGEQAIVGSTLLGGPGGSGGSSGSGSGTLGAPGAVAGLSKANGSTPLGPGRTGGTAASARGSSKAERHGSHTGADGSKAVRAKAYVYPQTSASSQDGGSAIGISNTDILALIAIAATLTLIGVLTMRFSRLQP